jgi:hypothetical protein
MVKSFRYSYNIQNKSRREESKVTVQLKGVEETLMLSATARRTNEPASG